MFNFLSAATAILGTIAGLFLAGKLSGFTHFIIPFAAGNFIYIAASNLVPQLHRQCKIKDTLLHVLAILLGIGIIVLVTLYGPAHGHGWGEKMKVVIVIFLVILILFTVGCDTELGHHHEDHDHDGDGVQDHAPENHDSELYEENEYHIEETSWVDYIFMM